MSKVACALLALAAVLGGTVVLSRWWYAHPDAFPRLPGAVWALLDSWFGVTNVDDAESVELLVVVLTAFFVVASLAAALALAWRGLRRH